MCNGDDQICMICKYGFLLILEVIALCVGMIYSTRTVRAETEALMSDFARIFNISGKEKVLFSAAMKNILNIDPEVQQPDRKVTEVVTENWTVISGKRLDLIDRKSTRLNSSHT